MTLRRNDAACSRSAMIDRPAFRELGKIAERWRDLAGKRRDYFSDLHRSGRWRRFYDQDQVLARIREVADVCDRWAKIVEDHRRAVSGPEAPMIDRDAA
jgi:uncharacterized repeat protein (TIGR03809 family)